MKLTKAKIDKAQQVLEAIAKELNSPHFFRAILYMHGAAVEGDGFASGDPYRPEIEGETLYDAYINALHTQAGTEAPPIEWTG